MTTKASKVFSISSYDLNPKKQARLTTMANFFQEMAYHHADQLGFGYDDLKEKQTYWVLSRMKIRIKEIRRISISYSMSQAPNPPGWEMSY